MSGDDAEEPTLRARAGAAWSAAHASWVGGVRGTIASARAALGSAERSAGHSAAQLGAGAGKLINICYTYAPMPHIPKKNLFYFDSERGRARAAWRERSAAAVAAAQRERGAARLAAPRGARGRGPGVQDRIGAAARAAYTA